MNIIGENAQGFMGFEGNEQTLGSKYDDPAKLRLTAPIYEAGGGGGVLSFNRSRNDGIVVGGGNQEEMGFIRVEQSESVRGQVSNLRGELNIFLNDGSGEDDKAMVRAFAIECDKITKINPALRASLRQWILGNEQSIPASISQSGLQSDLQSSNGRYRLHLQEDGNFVIYDISVNPWKPKWSWMSGVVTG